jgi:hypothetical protein
MVIRFSFVVTPVLCEDETLETVDVPELYVAMVVEVVAVTKSDQRMHVLVSAGRIRRPAIPNENT